MEVTVFQECVPGRGRSHGYILCPMTYYILDAWMGLPRRLKLVRMIIQLISYLHIIFIYVYITVVKPSTYRAIYDGFLSFPDNGLAVPLGPLCFLPPTKKFLVQRTLVLSSSL